MASDISENEPCPPRLWLIAISACLIPLILGAHTLFEPFGRDQGIHATIAAALQNGLSTYRDVYNIKPPMTTATHWMALEIFGHSVYSIRYLDLILVMSGMAGLATAITKLGGSAVLAIGASAGFSSMFYVLTYWSHAQTDEWATLCVIFSLALLSYGWQQASLRRRFSIIFVAGTLMGVGFLYKYTIAGAGILIFAPALISGNTARFFWRDLLWFVFGGLAVLGLAVGFLAFTDTLWSFLEIQQFVTGYIGYSENNLSVSSRALKIVLLNSGFNGIMILIGLGVFVVRWIRQGLSLLHVVTVMLIAAGWLSGYVQGKGFAYHFIPILIGYSILFGWAIDAIVQFFRPRTTLLRMNVVLVWVVFWIVLMISVVMLSAKHVQNIHLAGRLLTGGSMAGHLETYRRNNGYSFPDVLEFSDALTLHRSPDDTLFLWGYETMLYFIQGTSPIYRYPYAWPFVVDFYDGRYTNDLLKRLENNPPLHFVVQKNDATPWVTGQDLESRQLLRQHPLIFNFLQSRYTQVLETEWFELWQNNTHQ